MEKKYDYKNFNDLTDDKIFNINLSCLYNPQLYDEISQDVVSKYKKDKHSNELPSIQNFLDNITNEYIKNKEDTLENFKTLKNNVKSDNLKGIVRELERAIFGYDYDDDNEEQKYEESIAERIKMRRQNKETDKKMHRELLPHQILTAIIQINLQKCIIHLIVPIIDDEKTEEETEQTEKVYEEGYDKEGYDGAGYGRWGFNKDGFNKDGFNEDGYKEYGFNKDGFNEDGYNEYGFNEDGYNKGRKKDKNFNKWGYNINGLDRQRLDKNGYNINGYHTSGYDSQKYNINGYNRYGLKRQGNMRKALKKNIPRPGLKILTPQQNAC